MGELVRPSELARKMGVPQQKIYQWKRKGLNLIKTEQGTRIDLDEANEFFKKNGITPKQNTNAPAKTTSEQKKKISNGNQNSSSGLVPKATPVSTQKSKAASTPIEVGQFLVWPKGTSQGVTVGKVVEKEKKAGVTVVKCNDGTEAIFNINDLKKFIREGKVSLLGIDVLLELIAEEFFHLDLFDLADRIRQIRDEYLKNLEKTSET